MWEWCGLEDELILPYFHAQRRKPVFTWVVFNLAG